jgi:hypothetical protein
VGRGDADAEILVAGKTSAGRQTRDTALVPLPTKTLLMELSSLSAMRDGQRSCRDFAGIHHRYLGAGDRIRYVDGGHLHWSQARCADRVE